MKKGFTIMEIIICIALIALISTTSIISFNFIKKNNKEKTLESMNDQILTAVNVYIETNSEIKDELYNNKNIIKIPLTTLENSGLIDFTDVDIDISDEYVMTMLGSANPDDDTCVYPYTTTTWKKGKEVVYVCIKENNESVDITKEVYYYKGSNPKNYIKYNENTYRIISQQTDGSLILYSNSTYNNEFNGKTEPISTLSRQYLNISDSYDDTLNSRTLTCSSTGKLLISSLNLSEKSIETFSSIDLLDIQNSSECSGVGPTLEISSFLVYAFQAIYDTRSSYYYNIGVSTPSYKIHLKSCMKIANNGATGDFANPYILIDECA